MTRQDFQDREFWGEGRRQTDRKEAGHVREVKAMSLGAAQRVIEMG